MAHVLVGTWLHRRNRVPGRMVGLMVSLLPKSVLRIPITIIPRIPFYSIIKTIFLLYLALPQTQGATYVYQFHLRPFFAKHEQQIDQAIAQVRARLYRFIQEKARSVWHALLGALGPGSEGADVQHATQPPPTMNNPAAGPAQMMSSLWTSYGPSILAGGAALIRQTAAATLPAGGPSSSEAAATSQRTANPLSTPPGSVFVGGRASDQTTGRRRLDAELDQLSSISMPKPTPPANNPTSSSAASASSGSSQSLRERTVSSGRLEGGEYDGYEVEGDEFVGGFVPQQPNAPSRASWFGWPRKDGYDRVKTD